MDSVTARGIAGAWVLLMVLGALVGTCNAPAEASASDTCPPVCIAGGAS